MGKSRSKSALSWLSTLAVCGAAAVVLLGGEGPSQAGSLVYTPINPSFGGNPNNGAVLLNEANAQNLPLAAQTAEQAAVAAATAAASSASSTSAAATPSQIFAEQLQSQLLSSFANQITQAIFGPNAQTSGTFSYGATTISFVTIAGEVNISINSSGSITNIVVPASP
jgi:curli production assembly/transport component CsgF